MMTGAFTLEFSYISGYSTPETFVLNKDMLKESFLKRYEILI
jgi:hypothetical protein